MNTNLNEETPKGRLSWVISLVEVIIVIAYFAIGFGGMFRAFQNLDFVGIFDSVRVAIWFLVLATMVVTVLCFVPLFRSKANTKVAIWNIIWLIFSIYELI